MNIQSYTVPFNQPVIFLTAGRIYINHLREGCIGLTVWRDKEIVHPARETCQQGCTEECWYSDGMSLLFGVGPQFLEWCCPLQGRYSLPQLNFSGNIFTAALRGVLVLVFESQSNWQWRLVTTSSVVEHSQQVSSCHICIVQNKWESFGERWIT